MTSDTLTNRTAAHHQTRKSMRTLTRHLANGQFDPERAMRLLRRNVRDTHPTATLDTQTRVAQTLLDRLTDATE